MQNDFWSCLDRYKKQNSCKRGNGKRKPRELGKPSKTWQKSRPKGEGWLPVGHSTTLENGSAAMVLFGEEINQKEMEIW